MNTSHDKTIENNAYTLITDQLMQRFNEVGRQDFVKNPLVIAKYFNPSGSQTWYATEYYPNQDLCYGFVTGMFCDEWGYFSIQELQDLKYSGIYIERDLYFSETKFKNIKLY
jgi:hypothetical protein